jgi:hypothetical protein
MMKIILLLMLVPASFLSSAQQASAITDAEKQGITIEGLDSIYRSAVHADTSLAVFKSESEQDTLLKAYTQLLQDFGSYLKRNGFKWAHPTRCWNRIYFDTAGRIDYFLYNFTSKDRKPEDLLTVEMQAEFNRLLSLFIRENQIRIQSHVPFAQCSPVTYMPDTK